MLARLLAWLRPGDDTGGTVWDLTPDWQYGAVGRLHGGGDARAEQEAAVEEVAERAEDLRDARE